jgi:hypothetical protein
MIKGSFRPIPTALPVANTTLKSKEQGSKKSFIAVLIVGLLVVFSCAGFATYYFVFRGDDVPSGSETAGSLKPSAKTPVPTPEPTVVQVFLSSPIQAVKLVFTKYTARSVATVVFVCMVVVALSVTLATVLNKKQSEVIPDKPKILPGEMTWSEQLAKDPKGFFEKPLNLGLSILVAVVGLVAIGAAVFGVYRLASQFKQSIPPPPPTVDQLKNDLLRRLEQCLALPKYQAAPGYNPKSEPIFIDNGSVQIDFPPNILNTSFMTLSNFQLSQIFEAFAKYHNQNKTFGPYVFREYKKLGVSFISPDVLTEGSLNIELADKEPGPQVEVIQGYENLLTVNGCPQPSKA